jgi:membrane-bound ClpP family serine protease
MILNILIACVGSVVFVVGGLVVLLSLRKRFANQDLKLIGKSARVETSLTPEGTVILGGELWPAQSTNGAVIPTQSLVRIVGVRDLSLLVEVCLS